MPGILGLITRKPGEWAEQKLERMAQSIALESFYSSGRILDKSVGAAIGWSALRGAPSDGMPLCNERRDVALVFSGEEFPSPDLNSSLRAQGHDFRPEGLAYLPHVYEQDGNFPDRLNGRFHGVLIDRSQRNVILFNDRYGMHRLYFYEADDTFYFAHEMKAILAACRELREVNEQGLAEFISCGTVLENRTLFNGIQVLPPASRWIFRDGILEQRSTYFHPKEWEDQEELEIEDYYRQVHETFARNLPRYFGGDRHIGMSLTGGLDTRLIVATRKPAPGTLPCYTFGSMFRENADARIARQVAEHCGQTFEVIVADQKFLSRFSEYADRTVLLTEGCVDVGRAPDLYLNERVRQIAPVRMTGNYGGEVLRCVNTFKPENTGAGVFSSDLLPAMREASETYARVRYANPVSYAVFQQAPWFLQGVLMLEQTQVSMRSPFLDNDFVKAVFRSPRAALQDDLITIRLIADERQELLSIPTDRGIGGHNNTLSRLAKRAFLEFLFKAEYLYDMGMPQWLARVDHAFSFLRFERPWLGQHKVFHFRVWYRDFLASYVKEMLLDSKSLSRDFVDRRGVELLVQRHLSGTGNYTNQIHKLLTLEIFYRTFLENSTYGPVTKTLSNHLATA